MALADDLLATLYAKRAIPGQLGLRPYRVDICSEYVDGLSTTGAITYRLTEADEQNPKVEFEKQEDVAFGNAPADIVKVKVTPYGQNAVELDALDEPVSIGQARHILLTGPGMTEGRKYRILAIDKSSPLRRVITAQSEGQALQGY